MPGTPVVCASARPAVATNETREWRMVVPGARQRGGARGPALPRRRVRGHWVRTARRRVPALGAPRARLQTAAMRRLVLLLSLAIAAVAVWLLWPARDVHPGASQERSVPP